MCVCLCASMCACPHVNMQFNLCVHLCGCVHPPAHPLFPNIVVPGGHKVGAGGALKYLRRGRRTTNTIIVFRERTSSISPTPPLKKKKSSLLRETSETFSSPVFHPDWLTDCASNDRILIVYTVANRNQQVQSFYKTVIFVLFLFLLVYMFKSPIYFFFFCYCIVSINVLAAMAVPFF